MGRENGQKAQMKGLVGSVKDLRVYPETEDLANHCQELFTSPAFLHCPAGYVNLETGLA